jgi:hypothetical protein
MPTLSLCDSKLYNQLKKTKNRAKPIVNRSVTTEESMKFVIFAISLVLGSSAFAALSPYWDSVAQIQAVTRTSDLEEVLKAGSIVSIQEVGDLTYLVSTQSCQAKVHLGAQIPRNPGPTTYFVKNIESARCR